MTDSTVSKEQVRHIAALANLELTAEELPAMRRDLNAVLGYIAHMSELDTTSVAPMAQVSEVLPGASADTPLRQDVHVDGLERERVLRSAPETDGAFFKVPRVIER